MAAIYDDGGNLKLQKAIEIMIFITVQYIKMHVWAFIIKQISRDT